MFEELNIATQSNKNDWRIDASGFAFKNISELEFNKTYMVCGMYMFRSNNNSAIKSHGILSIIDLDINEGFRVNLPVRYNYLVKQITQNTKYRNGINNEKCGVVFEECITKRDNVCYNVKLLDL